MAEDATPPQTSRQTRETHAEAVAREMRANLKKRKAKQRAVAARDAPTGDETA